MRYRERGNSEHLGGAYDRGPSVALLSVRSLRCASSSLLGRRGGAGVASGQDSRTAAANLVGGQLSEVGRLSEPELEGGWY